MAAAAAPGRQSTWPEAWVAVFGPVSLFLGQQDLSAGGMLDKRYSTSGEPRPRPELAEGVGSHDALEVYQSGNCFRSVASSAFFTRA